MSSPRTLIVPERESQAHEVDWRARFDEMAAQLAEAGKNFYDRGWVLGTSGNFSAVVSRNPLELAITPSGVDKGKLSAQQMLAVDSSGAVLGETSGRPSDETKLHLAIVHNRDAMAVL